MRRDCDLKLTNSPDAKKTLANINDAWRYCSAALLLSSGELGKEVLIALQRLGVETIATDRYDNPPRQLVAHLARTITLSGPAQLKALTKKEKPFIYLNALNKIHPVRSIPQQILERPP